MALDFEFCVVEQEYIVISVLITGFVSNKFEGQYDVVEGRVRYVILTLLIGPQNVLNLSLSSQGSIVNK